MTEYEPHRFPETHSEFIPLTNMSEYDIADENLPPAYDDPHYQTPQLETQMRAEETGPTYTALASNKMTATQRIRRVSRNRGMVAVGCGCLFLPGVAFLIAGIYIGVGFVRGMQPPKPPVALFFTPKSEGVYMFACISAIAAGLLAYPAAMFTVAFSRQCLCCCRRSRDVSPRNRGAPATSSGVIHKAMVCGLTALFAAPIIVGVVFTILLTRQHLSNTNDVYLTEDVWADKYVIFNTALNGSSASLFSSEKVNLGDVLFTQTSVGWTMQVPEIPDFEQTLEHVVYTNSILSSNLETYSVPIRFNATCRNNSTDNYLTGGLTDPAPYNTDLGFYCGPGQYNDNSNGGCAELYPDFGGDINLSLSPAGNATNVWTSYQNYQGIGKSYGPLGYWYSGTSPILQVAWITTSAEGDPCQGLEIYLSKDYEEASWIVLGLVWQWWIIWAQHNYNNFARSTACGWASLQPIDP